MPSVLYISGDFRTGRGDIDISDDILTLTLPWASTD